MLTKFKETFENMWQWRYEFDIRNAACSTIMNEYTEIEICY